MSSNPKLILEQTIDLSDEREISQGVKILKLDIEKVKRNQGDNLNYTIYSPMFLFLMVFSILKYDYTLWFYNNVLGLPMKFIRRLFGKRN